MSPGAHPTSARFRSRAVTVGLPASEGGSRRERFLADVLAGLSRPAKTLPCKYFYDRTGSLLFDRICELEEYYLTRTEMAIMRRHAAAMARVLGPRCALVELGSGSSVKTRLLLDRLEAPAAYVPIDISREHLLRASTRLASEYLDLAVRPVWADYSEPFALPSVDGAARTAIYFPGSTIGNFEQGEAAHFLRRIGRVCASQGGLLIGVDLVKDRATLEAAYHDREGVTAAFNLNLLARLNRELEADFRLDWFAHRAVYHETESRIEMYLVSLRRQVVSVAGRRVPFESGEIICTEYSHKYTLESFRWLAAAGGFGVSRVWTDPRGWFSVQWLEPTG